MFRKITGMSDKQIDEWTTKFFSTIGIQKPSTFPIMNRKELDKLGILMKDKKVLANLANLGNLGKSIIKNVYSNQFTNEDEYTIIDTVKFEDAIEVIDCIFKDIPINIEKCKDCPTQCVNYKKRLKK